MSFTAHSEASTERLSQTVICKKMWVEPSTCVIV